MKKILHVPITFRTYQAKSQQLPLTESLCYPRKAALFLVAQISVAFQAEIFS